MSGLASVAILALKGCSDGNATVAPAGGSGSSADCVGALVVDGVWYLQDYFNDDRLDPDELGAMIGEVDHELPCEAAMPEATDNGIWAFGPPPGSEVRSLPGEPTDSMLAAVTPDGVRVFRTDGASPLNTALSGDVESIAINSEYDGTTRFAAIDDPEVIGALVAEASAAETTGSPVDDSGIRYFIGFERPDGIVTVVPYWIDRRQLGDRLVGQQWSTAIDDALAASPDPEAVSELTLTGANGTARFHSLGACRHDRVDLDVTPGETLRATHDPDLEVQWWINTPMPPSPGDEPQSQTGTTLTVPSFSGTMIVEGILTGTGGVSVMDLCTTLRASR